MAAEPPSSTAVPPVYTVSRLQQLVTADLAGLRAGTLAPGEAADRIEATVASFAAEREAATARLMAEVTADAEGKVAADPALTSARAARLVEPRTGNQRGRILTFIVESGAGSTDYEIERDLRIMGNSVRPRRLELVEGGYLADSGKTRQHRGSEWVVWSATDAGRAWYARTQGGAA
ncbi:hypothetical protein [Amycolatopsis sp. VC5-11]|uniref:hypothetical protein n=1 Tax=Amycolatopsis sp. VC5-11 TaxID=3120156 RepID=UPI00300BB4EC